MREKTQAIPSEDYISAVFQDVIKKMIQQLSAQINHSLSVEVYLYKNDELVRNLGVILCQLEEGNEQSTQEGEARLKFRETYVPTRYLFRIDAILEKHEHNPSFSGFMVKGDIKISGSSLIHEVKGLVINHNDWNWHPWF
jgi:hypothetical protein